MSEKTIKLWDKIEPAVKAGEVYTIETTNFELRGSAELTDQAQDVIHTIPAQRFSVQGDKYFIQEKDIASRYPNNHSTGSFTGDLPFITFYRKKLPWIRPSKTNQSWMSLLLLKEEDLDLTLKGIKEQNQDFSINPSIHVSPGTEDAHKVIRLPKKWFFERVQGVLKTDTGELRPRVDALINSNQFCHVREVSLENSVIEPSHHQADEGIKDGSKQKSVVLCNEPIPKSQGKYYLYLVSLENVDSSNLDEHTDLTVLSSWSFENDKLGHDSFEIAGKYLFKKEGGQFKTKEDGRYKSGKELTFLAEDKLSNEESFFQYPESPSKMNDLKFSFRGPFSPVSVKEDDKLINRIIEFFQYPKVSYRVAYELGRLIALSDKSYLKAKLQLKNHYIKKIHTLHHNGLTGDKSKSLQEFLESCHVSKMVEIMDKTKKRSGSDRLKEIPKERPTLDQIIESYHSDQLHMLGLEGVSEGSSNKESLLNENEEETSIISKFYSDIMLLKRIPFGHLVPKESLLPKDSIKFFHIDPNWMLSALRGVASVGYCPQTDLQFEEHFETLLHEKGKVHANNERNVQLNKGEQQPEGGKEKPAICGFFIRGSFVKDFPGIEVSINDGVPPVRMHQFDDVILMCLFSEIPTKITIKEPDHGLKFRLPEQKSIKNSEGSATIAQKLTKKRQIIQLPK